MSTKVSNFQELARKWLRKEMGFQSPAECRQRLTRRHIGRYVASDSSADNQDSSVGDSWQPDARHHQTDV